MASKFNDVVLTPLSELTSACEEAGANPDELASLELEVLGGLDWGLHAATPYTFYDHVLALCGGHVPTDAVRDKAHLYMDMTMFDYDMLEYHPAVRTCAALLLAWGRSPEAALCGEYIEDMCAACHASRKQMEECKRKMDDHYNSVFPTAPSSLESGRRQLC